MMRPEDFDTKIEEAKHRVAQLEERKRAALAREREQSRKWRAATVAEVGEEVLSAAGCDWTRIDPAATGEWLREHAEGLAKAVGVECLSEEDASTVIIRATRAIKSCPREARADDRL